MNDHYNEVLPGKLYVGDKHVAEDSSMLELMGVTHIVSCGFEYPLQPARCVIYYGFHRCHVLQLLFISLFGQGDTDRLVCSFSTRSDLIYFLCLCPAVNLLAFVSI